MAKKNKIPDECKNCTRLHTGGIKDSIHNMWCCAYQGAATWRQIGHCRNTGYSMRVERDK